MPKKIVFTDDQVNAVKEMIERGIRQSDIAKHFHITDDTLRRICKENNIEVKKPYICVCELCGKSFRSNIKTAKYCNMDHRRKCIVCGKEFTLDTSNIRETCSRRCTNIYKFGTEWPSQSASVKKKKRNTLISKYGITNVSQMKDHNEKVKTTCLSKYGVDSYAKTKECKDKVSSTCMKRYGMKSILADPKYHNENSFCNPLNRKIAHDAFVKKYGVDNPMKISSAKDKQMKSIYDHLGVYHPSQSKDIMSKIVKSQRRTVCSDGTVVDSNYERIVYEFLIANNITFKRQVPIQYEYNNTIRTTFIDFMIEDQLFECKGSHLLHGCYDYFAENVPTPIKLEIYRKHNVVLITDEDGKDLFYNSNGFKYDNNSLIGVDINLFSYKCPFPYRADRPRCFYDVKIDGQLSSHDAFLNPSIRWKMIINRIKYSGGFIDNKQILTALNVTRTCKQPSWFSKSLAIRLLKTYSTCDTVYDLAAGWGARADACKELNKEYVACDFNKELVTWHHEQGRECIRYHDGRSFIYDKSCTIFICPPYSDASTGKCFEDYNFEGFDDSCKQLSQCDWLTIAMKNAPNFKEAILVCKIVDEGFDKYIVETIHNKSHFGDNREYVLLIKNKTIEDLV